MRVEIPAPPLRTGETNPAFDLRLTVHPDAQASLAAFGLTTPAAFLAIPGEIVSGHPDRHVMRVVFDDGRTAFMKKEHRIRFKDRLLSWWQRHGWSSKSVREGRILRKLEQQGLPGPRWLAYGEDGQGRAFLVIEEVANAHDLRRAWPGEAERNLLAIQLGRFCAELHEAGVDHPDLYAKHFLIDRSTNAMTLLDWPRARIGNAVPWRRRMRALATLLATIPGLERRQAARLLWAYRRVTRSRRGARVPTFAALARGVEHAVTRLLGRRGIREQRQPPLDQSAQRLVWLDGEALCAIPEVAADLDPSEIRKLVYQANQHGHCMALSNGMLARLEVGGHRSIMSRLIARLRGKAWRSPELRKARLLFHLERHHVHAPKLLAYGQRCRPMRASAFVLAEVVNSTPLPKALRDADEDMRHLLVRRLAETLNRLHEAGCEAATIEAFAVQSFDRNVTVVVADSDRLIFRKRLNARRQIRDVERIARSMMDYCGADEDQSFLHAIAENRG